MRNPVFFIIFGLIIILFGLLNYYIGLRGWQTLGSYFKIPRKIYWVSFWFLAFSYIAARIVESFLPTAISRILVIIGANWLVFMYYFIIIIALTDIVRVVGKLTGLMPQNLRENSFAPVAAGFLVLALVTAIWGYGTWNARHPRVTHYDIEMNKSAGKLKNLHVVMVSDIHLGTIMETSRLNRMVNMVNELNPDVVLLAGDVIDEDVEYFVQNKMDSYFRKIRSKYGVYAVLGNHEYIGRNADEAVQQLTAGGVTVLKDKYVKVTDSFYIAGRDDKSGARFTGRNRKEVAEVLAGIDRSLPVILMDHQPTDLEPARQNGVDLQVSGHTHRGQMYPNQLITSRIYNKDYGHLREGVFNLIVSSGYGTWGPPVKIGNPAEIVDINIQFNK